MTHEPNTSQRQAQAKPFSFRRTAKELWSLVVGLQVTGKNFADSQLTVHYPRQQVDSMAGYRGHIELVGKPKDPTAPKCIICMMCVKVCPSNCITVKMKKQPKPAEGEEAPKKKPPKEVEKFELDYNLCSLCGLCVQNCPVNSLQHSDNVYLAGASRQDFEFDLLARLHAKAAHAAANPAPQPKEEPGAKAAKTGASGEAKDSGPSDKTSEKSEAVA